MLTKGAGIAKIVDESPVRHGLSHEFITMACMSNRFRIPREIIKMLSRETRRQKHDHLSQVTEQKVPVCVKRWSAHCLLNFGKNKIVRRHGIEHQEVLQAIGMGEWLDKDVESVDKSEFIQALGHQYSLLQAECHSHSNHYLKSNLKKVARLLGLNTVEVSVLEFAIYLNSESILQSATEVIGELNALRMFGVLSGMLDIQEVSIREALSFEGRLARSGLLEIDFNGRNLLQGKLDLLSAEFSERMLSGETELYDLIRTIVMRSKPAKLTMADYQHVQEPLSLLFPYLQVALKNKRRGVNILIHGKPGTGKTELVRLIAKKLRAPLYEVAFEGERGEPVLGHTRLKACSVAQHFFAKVRSLIIFDEVEDIFNDGTMASKSTAQIRKAWLNRNLEENAVPTFWVSNCIDAMDPAFIRRFDMVFEVPNPPLEQRQKMIRRTDSGLLTDDAIQRIAEHEEVSPAVIHRATSLVRAIETDLPADKREASLEFLISSTLKAQGFKKIKPAKSKSEQLKQTLFDRVYSTSYINSDTDITTLAEGLGHNPEARICFYGPPGTGKTEFARWLAKQLDKKIHVQRCSDLLSKWLGETEENMARAFAKAEKDKAILLIDEVDSFLQDRRKAERSWETTQVNEMLTQMEQFNGIFIASTNLVDNLDQAALRRFDLKVKFNYLSSDQTITILENFARALELPLRDNHWQYLVHGITNLAPGDLAAIVRQHRFKPFKDADGFVQAVVRECQLKEGGVKRGIGFLG